MRRKKTLFCEETAFLLFSLVLPGGDGGEDVGFCITEYYFLSRFLILFAEIKQEGESGGVDSLGF